MKLKFLLFFGALAFALAAVANPVTVKMNAVSKTMTLQKQSTGEFIDLPAQNSSLEYELNLEPGDYLITGIDKDGHTVNGTIVMNVTDSTSLQHRAVITCTAYVSNKDDGGVQWTKDRGDYALDVKVNTREGVAQTIQPGNSSTSGRYTFLAFNGNSYNVAFEPCEAHKAEGFMTLYKGGTLTANINVTGAIPKGGEFAVTVPADAEFHLGMKFTHFADFTPVAPAAVEPGEGGTVYRYVLANGQVYNYRTWKSGGLTHGGYFTMNLDETKCPKLSFNAQDYSKKDPKKINHDVKSNAGYETGDILLNVNSDGHLRLRKGEKFKVHAMRMWELTDNSTNNYFFEPDFHYTVVDLDGHPLQGVISIENADTHDSAWSDITAIGEGTAIVLVTYDGINLNFYNNAEKKDYLGGEYWGAIWPENTGVFVVTVGDGESFAKPEMIVNEQYNVGALRLAGKYADAEHDVFYYLDDQDHFSFKFKSEGVASVEMASMVLSDTEARYAGFSDQGVTLNEDGSYTLDLKKGRNIVRLTDAAGMSVYRILRAKPCHREIINLTREGSEIFQPGDKIKIQYSGLFHPANKIAGIYNMSAYVTYNGVPNGSSLILGSGQYTFGSAASAQAVSVEIPEDFDAVTKKEWVMNQGVIQVNGYGDPIGNHRNTSHTAGRSPNFTAVPHQTYFGMIPDIRIPISPIQLFNISLASNVEGAETVVMFGNKVLQPGDDGNYSGTFGQYSVTAKKDGYRCFRQVFSIGEDAVGDQVFEIEMEKGSAAMWDGSSLAEIEADESGVYHVSTGAQLAYIQSLVAADGNKFTSAVVLDGDIDLGDFDWSPIGISSSKPFVATFDGNGHKISGLYINQPTSNNIGLFGYVKGSSADVKAVIKNVTVEGSVCGKQYVAGIVANLNANAVIERCANYARISGASSYVGGVVGYMAAATVNLSNCYNQGDVSGTTNVGGVIGYNNANSEIQNIYSTGEVSGTNAANMGACVGSTTSKAKVVNAFTTRQYDMDDNSLVISKGEMASGKIAYLLGEAFRQTIGEDAAPVFDALEVFYDEAADEYYNLATDFDLDLGEGKDEVEIEDGVVVMHPKVAYTLSVVATPALARLPEISWTSNNEEVATVSVADVASSNGLGEVALTATGLGEATITATGFGEATITATAIIGCDSVSRSCTVKVVEAHTTGIDEFFEAADFSQSVDIYDINGRVVKLEASPETLRTLTPGLYILRSPILSRLLLIK